MITSDCEDDDAEAGGKRVRVWPSVVRVVGAVIGGSVSVSDPMMMLVPLNITIPPLGSVTVVILPGCGGRVMEDTGVGGPLVMGGLKVRVWPSVVIIVGAVIGGSVSVSDPIMMLVPLKITIPPLGSVTVVTVLGGSCDDEDAGKSVSVRLSVVMTLSEVIEGRVMVFEPMTVIEGLPIVLELGLVDIEEKPDGETAEVEVEPEGRVIVFELMIVVGGLSTVPELGLFDTEGYPDEEPAEVEVEPEGKVMVFEPMIVVEGLPTVSELGLFEIEG